MIIITAMLIDVFIWGIYPLVTYDVLYLIGISIIFNSLVRHFETKVKITLTILIFLIYFMTSNFLDYRFEINEFYIDDISSLLNFKNLFLNSLQRMIYDGWFPILPWIAFPIIGSLIPQYNVILIKHLRFFKLLGIILILYGIINLTKNQVYQSERENYLEIFYPITLNYLFFVLGIIMFISIDTLNKLSGSYWVITKTKEMGKNSLFIYIIHSMFIRFVFSKFYQFNNSANSLIIISFVIILCYLASELLIKFQEKKIYKLIPITLRKLIGI
jgi:surface polysaccharide O-acyltransferase-like enzyme